MGLPLTGQPLGWVGEQCTDLLGVQRLGDSGAGQPGTGDPQLLRHHLTGERTVASQIEKPLRRIGSERVQLAAGDG